MAAMAGASGPEDWRDPVEDEGITLGPEEALQREIEKSKALKVERLQLRNRVETLEQEKSALIAENQRLKSNTLSSGASPVKNPAEPSVSSRWAWFLVIFNLVALGLLLVLGGRK